MKRFFTFNYKNTDRFIEGDIGYQDTPDQLTEAILISLFTNGRALPDDNVEYRYGHWADQLDPNGYQIGSRLYLLKREKITNQLIPTINDRIKQALQWLIDDGIAVSVDVTTARVDIDRIESLITLGLPDATTRELKIKL
jgi:phage gp46-like protein